MITGARIRARRVAAGISLRELASELRVTAVELGEIERGKRSVEFLFHPRRSDRLESLFPGIWCDVDPIADAHEATMAEMRGEMETRLTAKLGWIPGEFSNTLEQARKHLPTKESMAAALDRAEPSLVAEWRFSNGHKLTFGPDDGEPYRSALDFANRRQARRQPACRWCDSTEQLERTETGWRCMSCLTGADAESPDYEALGYPETRYGFHHDVDAIAMVAVHPIDSWLRSFTTDPL